jgi:hypothetical protein
VFTATSWNRSAMLGIATLAVFTVAAPQARAGFIATVQQVGSNVVITGTGSLNTTALSVTATGDSYFAGVNPNFPALNIGAGLGGTTELFGGITGPTAFGTCCGVTFETASSNTGNIAGINNNGGLVLMVPQGYVSGTVFSDSDTFLSETIAGLGITPGTYTWSWGTGPTADFFELSVGASTPEPASVVLVGSAMLGLLALRRRIAR